MEVRFGIGTKPTWFRDGPYQTGSIPFINTKVVDWNVRTHTLCFVPGIRRISVYIMCRLVTYFEIKWRNRLTSVSAYHIPLNIRGHRELWLYLNFVLCNTGHIVIFTMILWFTMIHMAHIYDKKTINVLSQIVLLSTLIITDVKCIM